MKIFSVVYHTQEQTKIEGVYSSHFMAQKKLDRVRQDGFHEQGTLLVFASELDYDAPAL